MKRADWLDRLWETIEAHRLLPFRWGATGDAHDCCTFAASCIDAMTGSGHVCELLTHYHDEPTALEYIAAGGGLAAVISAHLGGPKRLAFMSRGDVALVERDGVQFVGICIGDTVISAGPIGLVENPAHFAVAAWGV